jgi:hypothetical protein
MLLAPPDAKPENFKKATEEIFHTRDQASRIDVLVAGK